MIKFSVRGYPWENGPVVSQTELKNSFKGCVLLAVKADDFDKLDSLTAEFCRLGRVFARDKEFWRLIVLPYKQEKLCYQIKDRTGPWECSLGFDEVNQASLDPKIQGGMFDVIKNWSGFFDLLSFKEVTSDNEKVSVRFDELPRILKSLNDHDGDVYKPLIVKISDDLTKPLPAIAGALRKILSRQDRMVKLDKVMEINLNSMRWLVRQPGRTIEQKAAANDYHVLAVTRKENYDLLENRVLKDFLIRCVAACTDYLDDSKASVAEEVKHYQRLCRDFLGRSELSEVRRQRALPVPNYVLQFDARYSKIWHYYVMLLRHEKIAEELFFWQYFTFLDLCALFCGAALHDLQDDPILGLGHQVEVSALGSCSVSIYPDAKEGVLLNADSAPGPFILTVDGQSYAVQFVIDAAKIENPEDGRQIFTTVQLQAAQFASALGSRSYLLVEKVASRFESKRPAIILLYGLNFNLRAGDAYAIEILHSAQQGMEDFALDMHLGGTVFDLYSLVVLCTKNAQDTVEGNNAIVTAMQAQVSSWPEAFLKIKESLLKLLIKVAS